MVEHGGTAPGKPKTPPQNSAGVIDDEADSRETRNIIAKAAGCIDTRLRLQSAPQATQQAQERQVTLAGTRPNSNDDLPQNSAEGINEADSRETRNVIAKAAGVSHAAALRQGSVDAVETW